MVVGLGVVVFGGLVVAGALVVVVVDGAFVVVLVVVVAGDLVVVSGGFVVVAVVAVGTAELLTIGSLSFGNSTSGDTEVVMAASRSKVLGRTLGCKWKLLNTFTLAGGLHVAQKAGVSTPSARFGLASITKCPQSGQLVCASLATPARSYITRA